MFINKKISLLIITAFIFIFSLLFLFFKAPVCGNLVCEKGENCLNCKIDCSCQFGMYCHEGVCISPTCGNKKCEPFETPYECCIDCECWGKGEICNIEINKCEIREIKISDEKIKELVIEYFKNKSKEIEKIEIKDLITWENKLGKNVIVVLKNQEWFIPIIVTEDEKIIEFES
ncbi:MAG: hypothetical protein QW641_00895 [Candidatus Aenigmatarchaeota archaeon]